MKIYKLENKITVYPIGIFVQEIKDSVKEMTQILVNEHGLVEDLHILCTGSSGAIISALIAFKMPNVVIHHLKKRGENSHDPGVNLYPYRPKDIYIVDDLIYEGNTIKRLILFARQRNCHIKGIIVGKCNVKITTVINFLGYKPEIFVSDRLD